MFYETTSADCGMSLFHTKISGLPKAVILIAANPVPPVDPVIKNHSLGHILRSFETFYGVNTLDEDFHVSVALRLALVEKCSC